MQTYLSYKLDKLIGVEDEICFLTSQGAKFYDLETLRENITKSVEYYLIIIQQIIDSINKDVKCLKQQ
jgi:hypothetical protein